MQSKVLKNKTAMEKADNFALFLVRIHVFGLSLSL